VTDPVQSPVADRKPQDGDFLTKEQLADKARFKPEEEPVEIPELGGKVLVRGISIGERTHIRKQLPATLDKWGLQHTALMLAGYVAKPELTESEWKEILAPIPATAVDRINRTISKVADITDAEEGAAAVEFQGSDL
jgi:hypothetical protein